MDEKALANRDEDIERILEKRTRKNSQHFARSQTGRRFIDFLLP